MAVPCSRPPSGTSPAQPYGGALWGADIPPLERVWAESSAAFMARSMHSTVKSWTVVYLGDRVIGVRRLRR